MIRIILIICAAFGLAAMLDWSDGWIFNKPVQPCASKHGYVLAPGQIPTDEIMLAALDISCLATQGWRKCR